ncbi:hypothetical protein [uncultured Tateyamaria sp.]|uniref:hypothetical protein n=1 Tax=uncultured Tateyamaria sp. TaxID=455651 RepID=UPI00262A6872|nr:hypothetical protein [uncultured Tateyamaria sp.]
MLDEDRIYALSLKIGLAFGGFLAAVFFHGLLPNPYGIVLTVVLMVFGSVGGAIVGLLIALLIVNLENLVDGFAQSLKDLVAEIRELASFLIRNWWVWLILIAGFGFSLI